MEYLKSVKFKSLECKTKLYFILKLVYSEQNKIKLQVVSPKENLPF